MVLRLCNFSLLCNCTNSHSSSFKAGFHVGRKPVETSLVRSSLETNRTLCRSFLASEIEFSLLRGNDFLFREAMKVLDAFRIS